MKKIITLISIILGIALQACTTTQFPEYTPPKVYNINNRIVADLNFEDTWYRILKYLYIEHSIPAKLDKENGLIAIESNVIFPYIKENI